ncbi:TetR/AcrR family transcriptional regulator [Cytobacillus kochii]|uniref:TetR/AcrR family transcriptional regulator n=1 Tax=Cytobacillus kochii TaxID=859143 RepID=UPI001CD2892D|nr:TetR/AcrR family transcriptional regulator [Cytobacillus kochii]MCA1028920.1 TetR/AcrR family transcriptional regulator [Cytobacillus kochii]MCM3323592.1 TetR/AcrR family transcriptional regulator [Cytobacillus kochii]MCM3345987.1 TetR/AcrR family transcriptional regulator [Cytobacillus kochii]
MPRSEEQYEAMRIATKNKIHTAAIKLFAKKGFAATGVKDIAEEAGISIGLMYRHYKKKEDLFNELVTYAVEGLKRIIKKFQSNESPVELILQLTLEILNDLDNDDEYAYFQMLMNQSSTIENLSPQIQQLNMQSKAMFNQTARLIEKGQILDQFKKGDPMEMALFYFATIQGLTMMKITMNNEFITPSREIVTSFLIKD